MTKRVKAEIGSVPAVVITCEHGGNRVPAKYRNCFVEANDALESHRGWDPGALKLAREFSAALKVPLYSSSVTRLLVELNRSRHHPRLFSEFTAELSADQKQCLLDEHWSPYRSQVERAIATAIETSGHVVHLSVHSFTPVWDGETRRTDVGLLYDPQRKYEKEFCQRWCRALSQSLSELCIHRNSPYRGTSDGFVTHLRRQFSENTYTGIELEVNQKFFLPAQTTAEALAGRTSVYSAIITSFQQTLTG